MRFRTSTRIIVALLLLLALEAHAETLLASSKLKAEELAVLDRTEIGRKQYFGEIVGLSPDGKWLVSLVPNPAAVLLFEFSKDQVTQAYKDFGVEKIDPASLSWSPNGRHLAFAEEVLRIDYDSDIWVIDTEKKAATNLTDDGTRELLRSENPAAVDRTPAWFGSNIIFSRFYFFKDMQDDAGATEGIAHLFTQGTRLLLLDEAAIERIKAVSDPKKAAGEPRLFGETLDRDYPCVTSIVVPKKGQRIFFNQVLKPSHPKNGIWSVDLNGENPRQIFKGRHERYGPGELVGVTDSGETGLVYFYELADEKADNRNLSAFGLIDMENGGVMPVKEYRKGEPEFVGPTNAVFSPDHSKILYIYRDLSSDTMVLAVREILGETEKVLLREKNLSGVGVGSRSTAPHGLDWVAEDKLYVAFDAESGLLLQLGVEAREADALLTTGKLLSESDQCREAIVEFEEAAEMYRGHGTMRIGSVADCSYEIGKCYAKLGQHEQAIRYYHEALAIYEQRKDLARIIETQDWLSRSLQLAGLYRQAVVTYRKMALDLEAIGKRRQIGVVLNNIAFIYQIWGQYQKAVVYYERALKIFEEEEDAVMTANSTNNIGLVYQAWGQFDRALEYFEKALLMMEKLEMGASMAINLSNIGTIYTSWGLYDRALEYFEESLAFMKRLGETQLISTILGNIGGIHEFKGDFDKAIAYYRQALEWSEKRGSRNQIALSLLSIGSVYRVQKKYATAMSYARKALSMAEESGITGVVASSLNAIGIIHNDNGEYRQALDNFEKALLLNREVEAKAAVAMSLFNLGTAHYNLQNYREAITNFNESIGLIEQLRLTAMGAVRRDFLASQIDRYRWLASAHIRANEADSAFDTVELSSAKYLIEQMRERMKEEKADFTSIANHRKGIPPKRAVLSFANVNWNGAITRFAVDREGISASELSIDSFVVRINEKFEQRISFTIKSLGGALKGRRSRENQQEAKSSPAFDAIINYYRHLLSKPDLKTTDEEAREEIGRALYDLLFSGSQESLASKTELLIIPGGILAFVPFETLIMPDGRYLVERFHIRYTQSLTVSTILNNRRYNPKGKDPLLAFGGALYGGSGNGIASTGSETPLTKAERGSVIDTLRGFKKKGAYDRLGYGIWADLPGSLVEVNRIKEIVPGTKIYSGRSVSESTVKNLSDHDVLKHYRVIHFATHGLVVPEAPELSALVLSQKSTGAEYDGYLRMEEIAALEIEAEFVNLSACETGLGKIYGGEGVVGLTQSFLVGGANGLSVSLWQVADESTMEFMVGLYSLAHQADLTYDQALTEMKRRFIKGRYAAPFYWAPFVYYGK